MKLKDVKINKKFKSFSGVEFKKLPITRTEKRMHKNYTNKVIRLDTSEIFYLEDNFTAAIFQS